MKIIATEAAISWFDSLSNWRKFKIIILGLAMIVPSIIAVSIEIMVQAYYDEEHGKKQ